MRLFLAILFASALLATGAAAGSGKDGRAVVEHIFEVADTDKSGALSREEYAKAGLERFGVSFEQCDANQDGQTSLTEYLALYERHHPPADQVAL